MAWTIEYGQPVRKTLEKLDLPTRQRIRRFLEQRVARLDDPRQIADRLQGAELGQYWRYRVGDFRNPFIVGETIAQLADFLVQAAVVIGPVAAHVALGLQGFQQAAHRGAVQAGGQAQFGNAGPAFGRAADGLQHGQPPTEPLHMPVSGTAG